MNNQEIRLILGASRPEGQDNDDPVIRKALDAAERDPELASWLAREHTLDALLSTKLRSVPVPATLKDEILAGGRITKPVIFWRDTRTLISAVAAVVFAAVTVWNLDAPHRSEVFAVATPRASSSAPLGGVATLASFRSDMADAFAQWQSVGFTPDLRTNSPDQVNDYLRQRVSAGGGLDVHQIVDQLQDVRLFGCRIADWRGQKVSMLCLNRDGENAHLFVVSQGALTAVDEVQQRKIDTSSGYPVSAWREGDKAYVLVGHTPTTDLTKFF